MSTDPKPSQSASYEPPALHWLGALGRRTELTGGPFVDGPGAFDTGPFSSSDRELKERFAPVDGREILAGVRALAIRRWRS